MIVLDEQLLGRNLEQKIVSWYRGTVCFITDLRPDTVIKDDAIPSLLRKQKQPTFITINEKDFWPKIKADRKYCVICFALPDSCATEISAMLRFVLRNTNFRTKALRMGKVLRSSGRGIRYYSFDNKIIRIE